MTFLVVCSFFESVNSFSSGIDENKMLLKKLFELRLWYYRKSVYSQFFTEYIF